MTPTTMKTPALSTIYLDNQRIGLMGDPKPLVSKVIAASGKSPQAVRVLRGKSPDDLHGKPLRLDETLDRTAEPAKAIYLTCTPKSPPEAVASNLADASAKDATSTTPRYVSWPIPDAPAPPPRGPLPPAPDGEAEWRP